jgi:hypothetical protein
MLRLGYNYIHNYLTVFAILQFCMLGIKIEMK